jgi:hypothetical protein
VPANAGDQGSSNSDATFLARLVRSVMNRARVVRVFACCSDRYVCVAMSAAYGHGVETQGGATASSPERWIHEQRVMVPEPTVAANYVRSG